MSKNVRKIKSLKFFPDPQLCLEYFDTDPIKYWNPNLYADLQTNMRMKNLILKYAENPLH